MHRESLANPGDMVAVLGMDIAAVQAVIDETKDKNVLAVANHNTAGQVVITGEKDPVSRAAELVKERAGKVIPLKVSGAWHCELMRGAVNDFRQFVEDIPFSEPNSTVLFNATAQETTGFIGNFQSTVAHPGGLRQLEHGVVILATGGHPLSPTEYLYGEHPHVILSLELDKAIAGRDPRLLEAQQVVFIQCVGSREPERPYCSRLCCTRSVESALALKELYPEMEVFILYRDMRNYGDKELLYKEGRDKGLILIRFELENKPVVEQTSEGGLKVTVQDPILGLPVVLQPDLLTLASAILPNPTEDLGEVFKVPRGAEGFFNEAHAKLRPVDCVTDGIYLAGLAHYPKPLEESVAQAKAAAVRAATVLSQEQVEVEPTVAMVDQNFCIGCGFCELSCPYHAVHLIQVPGQGLRAENLSAYCKGCGICAAGCPQRAIDMMHFRDRQVLAVIHAGGRLSYFASEGRWA